MIATATTTSTTEATTTRSATIKTTEPITIEEVTERWTNRPMDYRDCPSDELWEALFLDPVERFGLTWCLRDRDPGDDSPIHAGAERWSAVRAPLPPPRPFPVERITASTQRGVLIGVVHTVLTNGTHRAPVDPEGWFNNPHPLLMVRADGTAIVRDGNHRVCGAKLLGQDTIVAHAIPHDFDPNVHRWPAVNYLEH